MAAAEPSLRPAWCPGGMGLSRDEALAQMVARAMRVSEWQGTELLTKILMGRTDPEVPYRVETIESGATWVCIVREGCRVPVIPHG